MNIFDSHTHINSKEFANDLPDVVWRARALDVNMMLVLAYDQESADKEKDRRNKQGSVSGGEQRRGPDEQGLLLAKVKQPAMS